VRLVRVTLLTGCNAAFMPIFEPTLKGKQEYCDRYGINLVIRSYDPQPWGERNRYMLEEVQRCDWLWWLDADVLLMNHAVDIRQFCDDEYDCVAAADINGLNNGSVLFHNTPATISFIEAVLELTGKRHWQDDQHAMNTVMGAMGADYKVKWVSQRCFNSYLETEAGRPDDPKHAFRDGDLLIHLAGLSSIQRLRLVREYLAKVQK
jgi:hypothetical protein